MDGKYHIFYRGFDPFGGIFHLSPESKLAKRRRVFFVRKKSPTFGLEHGYKYYASYRVTQIKAADFGPYESRRFAPTGST